MAYIDKDKALNLDFRINVNLFESRRKTAERAVQAYADAISEIPAADVRPVVLCKDCKFNKREVTDLFGNDAIQCITGQTHRHDWFCADGEKREESNG